MVKHHERNTRDLGGWLELQIRNNTKDSAFPFQDQLSAQDLDVKLSIWFIL